MRVSVTPAAVLLAACSAAGSDQPAIIVTDSAGIEIVQNALSSPEPVCPLSKAPTLRIGSSDDVAQSSILFGVFDAATLSDGAVAVANRGSHEIRVYRPDGSFERAMGREGSGPGEFRSLYMLWVIPGDTLIAGDYRPWRFTHYTRDGKFIRTVEPYPRYGNSLQAAGVLADGDYIAAARQFDAGSGGAGYVHRYQVVVRHDAQGEVRDTIGRYSIGRYGQLGPPQERFFGTPVFEPRSHVAAAGDGVLIAQGVEREIAQLTPSGRTVRIVRWTGPSLDAGEAEVERYREQLMENAYTELMRETAEWLLAETRPVNDRFPAVEDVAIGRDGRLWVEEFPRPSFEGVGRWVVFEPHGTIRCIVRTPPRFEPFEFGAGHLLGKTLDSLDVEYVVRYELGQPEGDPTTRQRKTGG